MTRKDYVKLAGALAEARAEFEDETGASPQEALNAIEWRLSSILAADNPNFDRHRFHMAAIGHPITERDRP